METASYMRYILIGNRKILVEQPDGDKYRSVTEDIAVKQSVEGIRTEECVLAITNDGLFIGSSAGVGTHITPSEFAEAKSGISTSHSVVGHAYITRMPSVKSGMSTHHSVKGISTNTKLVEVESGISSTHEAKGKPTYSQLTKTSEGIGTENKAEMIYTTQPKFSEVNSGISGSENIEAKFTETRLSQVQNGISAGQNADATVETPSAATILAGKYEGRTGISMPTNFEINLPIAYYSYGRDYVASSIEAAEGGINVYVWRNKPLEDGELIGVVMTAQHNDLYVGTDDGTITVTSDTGVTAEEYAAFNSYFKLVAARLIRAGDYYGKSNYTFNQSYFNTVMTVSSDVIVSFTRSGLSYQRNGLYLYKTSSLNSYGFGVGSGGYTNICSWSPEVTQTITWNAIADQKISLDRDIYTNDLGYEIFFGVFSTQAN